MSSSLLEKAIAILRRDLLITIRYRTGLLITVLGAAAELAAFYYLARAVGPEFRPEGIDYFPFLLIGTGFYTFLIMSINAFLVIVQEAQQTGTLEVLMTTSTPAPVLLFLSSISAFAGSTAQLAFYLGAGLLFGARLHPNVAGCLVVFALSLVIAMAIGFLAAALQLAFQKGSALVWLLGSGAWFLTGTLFPVATLPKPLRLLGEMIPITHALDGMRAALLEGATFTTLAPQIGTLALFAVALLPCSLAIFSYTLRRARQEGTLSFY